MPKKRRYYPPPPPPATTFIVCHPADEWYVRWHQRTNEDLIITDRCPMQHIIYLPLRLKLLAMSGAWFDTSLDAEWVRGSMLHQQALAAAIEGKDKPRCQAWNNDMSQCKHAAASGENLLQPEFCKPHAKKRTFFIHKPGDGLDQESRNPLSEDALDEIRTVSLRIDNVRHALRRIQESVYLGAEESARLGEQYATLHDLAARLDAIVSGDRERDAKMRRDLSYRINRMVDRIAIARKVEGVTIHTAFMRSGGKSQKEMTIEELKQKVNWLLTNYQDVFPADTREWQPPDVVLTGREPGGIRRKDESDPVIIVE